MANVKYGVEIKTKSDLQNLITGLILRSTNYRNKDILNLTKKYFIGSKLEISDNEIIKMVDDTLDLFQRYDIVTCANGQYTTITTELTMVNYILQLQNNTKEIQSHKFIEDDIENM